MRSTKKATKRNGLTCDKKRAERFKQINSRMEKTERQKGKKHE